MEGEYSTHTRASFYKKSVYKKASIETLKFRKFFR